MSAVERDPMPAPPRAPRPQPGRRGSPDHAALAAAPIASEELFAGAREVQILHRGALYRLKQTALGKLILTK